MFYRIGTGREIGALSGKFHSAVVAHLKHCIGILDESYGADRNYLQEGGYMVIAETADDLPYVREILDLDKYPCEWSKHLDGVYVSALYLLNDDFAVVVVLPFELAPAALRKELED